MVIGCLGRRSMAVYTSMRRPTSHRQRRPRMVVVVTLACASCLRRALSFSDNVICFSPFFANRPTSATGMLYIHHRLQSSTIRTYSEAFESEAEGGMMAPANNNG